jgi:hypothetical protein
MCSFVKGFEHDHVVQPVYELRPEVAFQFLAHTFFKRFEPLTLPDVFENQIARDVARHDDYGVSEIDHVSFRICQSSIVHDL